MQCRKTGQEGPVRGRSGDWPCWRGCAVVDGASEMSRVVACLCLSASEAYLWSSVGERDKHGGTFDHFPRTRAAQSRAWANPHTVPAHRLTAMRLVRAHGHLTSCRSAQASVLSGLSTCVHMPRSGLVLVRGTQEHVLHHLECAAVTLSSKGVKGIRRAVNKTSQAKSHVFVHLRVLPASASRRQDALPIRLPHDKIERPY